MIRFVCGKYNTADKYYIYFYDKQNKVRMKQNTD